MKACVRWIVLGLLLIAWNVPAGAQPFKDSSAVPAWAYDAVAKLAAEGFVQGYPDGTFRGDRAMTRDEMAVIVARILAKIESIEAQLPSPQRPQAGTPGGDAAPSPAAPGDAGGHRPAPPAGQRSEG